MQKVHPLHRLAIVVSVCSQLHVRPVFGGIVENRVPDLKTRFGFQPLETQARKTGHFRTFPDILTPASIGSAFG